MTPDANTIGLWLLSMGVVVSIALNVLQLVQRVRGDASRVSVGPQPLVVSPDDPPITRSIYEAHGRQTEAQIAELRGRLDRHESKSDEALRRIHERIDELPSRIIALLADSRGVHS